MVRFVVVGQRAIATPDFSLQDLPGTSGRLDILVRCLRAGLLVSHGLRRDAVMYIVLGQGRRVLRLRGADARFVRPDERALATLVKKSLENFLAMPKSAESASFVEVRPGIAISDRGLDAIWDDDGVLANPIYLLDQGGTDLRDRSVRVDEATFFVGDHLGFTAETRAAILARGAVPIGLGPVSIHAEDAIAIVWNEVDRATGSRTRLSSDG